jgi:hypothetical protein
MCKELPVIPANKVVNPKRIIGKKWRAEEVADQKKTALPPMLSERFRNSVALIVRGKTLRRKCRFGSDFFKNVRNIFLLSSV